MYLKKHLVLFESIYWSFKIILLSPRYELENSVRCRQNVNLLHHSVDRRTVGGRGYQCDSLTQQQHWTVCCGLAGERGTLLVTLTHIWGPRTTVDEGLPPCLPLTLPMWYSVVLCIDRISHAAACDCIFYRHLSFPRQVGGQLVPIWSATANRNRAQSPEHQGSLHLLWGWQVCRGGRVSKKHVQGWHAAKNPHILKPLFLTCLSRCVCAVFRSVWRAGSARLISKM